MRQSCPIGGEVGYSRAAIACRVQFDQPVRAAPDRGAEWCPKGPRAVIVSVVIPAYNAARFIERALHSVRTQTFQGHETVVVDDGSIDGTSDVVQAYFMRHGISGRLLRQENRGMAAARNTGMRAANGAYVALLDSDDLWYPEKLAAVMAEFDRHPAADLICHDENIIRDGKIVPGCLAATSTTRSCLAATFCRRLRRL